MRAKIPTVACVTGFFVPTRRPLSFDRTRDQFASDALLNLVHNRVKCRQRSINPTLVYRNNANGSFESKLVR